MFEVNKNESVSLLFPEDLITLKENIRQRNKSQKLNDLLKKWKNLFHGLGKTDIIKHKIDVGNEKPIMRHSYRMPISVYPLAKESINEMLKEKVIEPSNSEWCFPVVPVKKKDGTIRIAIDYRKLNKISRKDAYPMPRIDDLLSKIKNARIFSRLDLKQGYYQIELEKSDKEKTAFRFDNKLYQFTRMPFGLCSAPQTFVRMMNKLFASDNENVLIYMDDCLIFSQNEKEHIGHLEKVFKTFASGGLRLNEAKCEFFKTSVEFLGFEIGNDEVKPLKSKVEAITKYPVPQNYKELSRFLGMAGYYRNLMPDYGKITSVLNSLGKKNKKFVWDIECSEAFEKVKLLLSSDPVVKIPDLRKRFIVKTDASMDGLGAVLMQEYASERHIIEYASKSFTDCKKDTQQLNRRLQRFCLP